MHVVQPIAAWLVARPQNSVLGLVAALVLPPTPVLGAAVMTLLLLKENNLLRAALYALIAAALLTVLNTVLGGSPLGVLQLAALTWLPATALALVLLRTRSLTLTVQIAAIGVLLMTLIYFLSASDNMRWGNATIDQIIATLNEAGLTEQAAILSADRAAAAIHVASLMALAFWSLFVLAMIAGTALFRSLGDVTRNYGRFSNLNLGRIVAAIVVMLCVAALASGEPWLLSLAAVAFLIFWVQGLSILHWLQQKASLPVVLLVLTYVLLPFLSLLLVPALALVGYIDAWFDFRRRTVNEGASR